MPTTVKDPVSGYSHLAGLGLALVGAAWLVASSGRDAGTVATSVVYGLCMIALYASSSTYHLVVADQRLTRALRLVDHIAIFLMVAGTCTPLFYRAFEGNVRVVMLGGIWTIAALGIAMKLLWTSAPRAVYTSIYVLMGWSVVAQWSKVASALPPAVLGLIISGGVVYTLGAVVYATKRPDPMPKVFGFHEIWHLFVLGGSALHYAAIARLAVS